MNKIYLNNVCFRLAQNYNNPITYVDPDGKDSFYNLSGDFLFTDLRKTYKIWIITKYRLARTLKNGIKVYYLRGRSLDKARLSLSAEAYSKIFTNVLHRWGYNTSLLLNGKISVTEWNEVAINNNLTKYATTKVYNNPSIIDGDNATTNTTNKTVTAYIFPKGEEQLLVTEPNIANMLGVHEYINHLIKGLDDSQHWKILQDQKKDPSWPLTTPEFKNHYDSLKKNVPWEYLNPLERKEKE